MLEIKESKDYQLIAQLNEEVQNLHCALHPEMFKPHQQLEMEAALKDYLSDINCHAYLVMQDGVAIAYAVFFIREAKENAFHYTIKTLYIDQISVLKKYRNTGAGQLLMQKAETLAQELSISKIELDHWSANLLASRFFRNRGYKLYKERLYKMIEPA